MKKIVWKTVLKKISELKDHPHNPRVISEKNHKELLKSFKKFDYAELIAINLDNTILAGHQRVHIMQELGWLDKEIEVRIPNFLLTDEDAKEYLIRSNKNTGEWNYEILANCFEVDALYDCGFEEKDFQLHGSDWEDEEEIEGKEFDESLTNDLSLIVRFSISIPNEDSTSFENQLTQLLKGFPRAKMEKKV